MIAASAVIQIEGCWLPKGQHRDLRNLTDPGLIRIHETGILITEYSEFEQPGECSKSARFHPLTTSASS
jgi:hypothetical protein